MYEYISKMQRRLGEVGFSEEQADAMIVEIVRYGVAKSRAKPAAEDESELEQQLVERLAQIAGVGKYAS